MTARHLAPALAVLAFAALSPRTARGGPDAIDRPPKRVFVPIQDWDKVIADEPDGILLDYLDFEKLLVLAMTGKAAKEGGEGPAPLPCLLQSADYTARIEKDLMKIDGLLRIISASAGPALLPLPLGGAGVLEAKFDGRDAALHISPAGNIELPVEGRGAHVLELSFVVPITDRPEGRLVVLQIPPAPASFFHARLPGDLEVETSPDFTETSVDGGFTEISSAIGLAGSFTLLFRPRTMETKLAPVVEVGGDLELRVAGLAKADWTLNYLAHRAPVSELRWAPPEGWTISSFDAPDPLNWGEIRGEIVLRFRKPKVGPFQIKIGMEREAGPGPMNVPVLRARGVDVQTGTARVYTDKRYSPRLVELSGARIVDFVAGGPPGFLPFRAFSFP